MNETFIVDKHGDRHRVTIGATIALDNHVISTARRDHNAVELKGFSMPVGLRGRGIGGAVIGAVERSLRKADVKELRVVIEDMSCPIHGNFWTKKGYTNTGEAYVKQL